MAMKELGIMRVGKIGSNALSIVVFLLIGRRRIAFFARGWEGWRTMLSRLLECCSRNEMIIDVSRGLYIARHGNLTNIPFNRSICSTC
jgi:hypothetical protein